MTKLERRRRRRNAMQAAWRDRNREKVNARKRIAYRRYLLDPVKKARIYARGSAALKALRAEALARYGGRCSCCGEKQAGFLTFDHKRNNGAAHRRTVHRWTFYKWLLARTRKSMTVLCWNCNSGRHYNGGVCPHKENR